MTIQIHITQEDIDLGQALQSPLVSRSRTCPTARAASREHGGEWHVGGHLAWEEGSEKNYRIPGDLAAFIIFADEKMKDRNPADGLVPGTYTLEEYND